MKTYPILNNDGTVRGFEITSSWFTFGPIYKILQSIDGVSDVHRKYNSDDRISFKYYDEPWIIHEPFGDNSRFWIGPVHPDSSHQDIKPIHEAFQKYNSYLTLCIYRFIKIIKGQQANTPDRRSAGR